MPEDYYIKECFNVADKEIYSGLYVEYCGQQRAEPGHLTGPSRPVMYVLHYIISGKGYLTINGKKGYNLKEGDVFLIKPSDIILHQVNTKEPWHICWFGFSGDRVEKMLEYAGINDYVIPLNNMVFYDSVMECISYFDQNEIRSPIALESFLLKGISGIEASIKNRKKHQTEHTELAKSYISINYGKGITVSDVATHTGLSRSHFFRIFKAEEGISPQEYLNNYRMLKAKELIRNNVSLKEVAFAVGINDVYYFSKLFKKTHGITPGEYKKKRGADKHL